MTFKEKNIVLVKDAICLIYYKAEDCAFHFYDEHKLLNNVTERNIQGFLHLLKWTKKVLRMRNIKVFYLLIYCKIMTFVLHYPQ